MGSPHRIVPSRGSMTSVLSHAHARARTHDRLSSPPLSLPSFVSLSLSLSLSFPLYFLTCIRNTFHGAKGGGREGERIEVSQCDQNREGKEAERVKLTQHTCATMVFFSLSFSLSLLSLLFLYIYQFIYLFIYLSVYLSLSLFFSRNTSLLPIWRLALADVCRLEKRIRDHAQRTGNCPHSAQARWVDGSTDERTD